MQGGAIGEHPTLLAECRLAQQALFLAERTAVGSSWRGLVLIVPRQVCFTLVAKGDVGSRLLSDVFPLIVYLTVEKQIHRTSFAGIQSKVSMQFMTHLVATDHDKLPCLYYLGG